MEPKPKPESRDSYDDSIDIVFDEPADTTVRPVSRARFPYLWAERQKLIRCGAMKPTPLPPHALQMLRELQAEGKIPPDDQPEGPTPVADNPPSSDFYHDIEIVFDGPADTTVRPCSRESFPRLWAERQKLIKGGRMKPTPLPPHALQMLRELQAEGKIPPDDEPME